MTTEALGGNAAEMLRAYAARIVRLEDEITGIKEEQIKPIQDDVKDVKAEAKSQGFDPKHLAAAIKRARMDANERDVLELYEAAIVGAGDINDLLGLEG